METRLKDWNRSKLLRPFGLPRDDCDWGPYRDRVPIVIGGCARSGTTLLLSILSSHPQVAAVPFETQLLCPTAYSDRPKRSAAIDLDAFAKHLEDVVCSESRFWCEKTPRNVLHFKRILRCFGDRARLIHLVRDGRDVVCSVHPDDPNDYWVSPGRWAADVSAGRAFQRHPQVLTVRYEDLVSQFESTLQNLCEFLELEIHDQLLDYPNDATVRQSNAWVEPAHAVTTKSIGRWHDERHSQRVKELLADRNSVRLLKHYRYL